MRTQKLSGFSILSLLVKQSDGKIIANEAKARNWNYLKNNEPEEYSDALFGLKGQFRKLRAIDDIDEIRLVSKFDTTDEIIDLANEYNVVIRVGNEVI